MADDQEATAAEQEPGQAFIEPDPPDPGPPSLPEPSSGHGAVIAADAGEGMPPAGYMAEGVPWRAVAVEGGAAWLREVWRSVTPRRYRALLVLVTGDASFMGAHYSLALRTCGDNVLGLDNFNAYYDPSLKHGLRVYNLDNTLSMPVNHLVAILEKLLGKKAHERVITMPSNGDVPFTHANVSHAARDLSLEAS